MLLIFQRSQKQNVVKTDKIDCRNICKQLKKLIHLDSITIPESTDEKVLEAYSENVIIL